MSNIFNYYNPNVEGMISNNYYNPNIEGIINKSWKLTRGTIKFNIYTESEF